MIRYPHAAPQLSALRLITSTVPALRVRTQLVFNSCSQRGEPGSWGEDPARGAMVEFWNPLRCQTCTVTAKAV